MFSEYLDGDFMSPRSGAKLASLFDLDQAESLGNDSFQFTAPKQPKKKSSSSTITGVSPQTSAPPHRVLTLLLASGAHAFRLVKGQYVREGKVGAAVLGTHITREYNILLYGNQQRQITMARIHTGFVFTVQPGNYGSFYDDQRQNWSLRFESEKGVIDFCKEVCLAKWNSRTSADTLLSQDLVQGEGQAVQTGDTLEVAFTGWLLQNHAVGRVFDSTVGRERLRPVKLGAGKVVQGWEEGMLGMQKGGRRLLIVPPSMAYGCTGIPGCVPPSSTLVYDVEIRRVKFAKAEGSDVDSAASSPSPTETTSTPANSVLTEQRELPLPVKSNSSSEQLKHSAVPRAQLVARVAKMGRPTLPFLTGAIPAQPDFSDSETEDASELVLVQRKPPATAISPPSPSPQPDPTPPRPPSCSDERHRDQTVIHQSETTGAAMSQAVDLGASCAFQPYPLSQAHNGITPVQPFGPVLLTQTVPFHAPDVTTFLMTEVGQHSAEMRLAVGRISDKVDQLAIKVDDLLKRGSPSFGLCSVSMETSMIVNSICRLDQENTCLRKEVLEKNLKVEQLNHKIQELLEQNQRCVEHNTQLLEQRSEVLQSHSQQKQACLLQAEHEKMHLAEELRSSSSLVCQLQQEAVSLQQRAAELQVQLCDALQDSQRHCTHISSLEARIEELKASGEQSHLQLRSERQQHKQMELRVRRLEEEIQDLRDEKENLDQAELEINWGRQSDSTLLEEQEQCCHAMAEQMQHEEELEETPVQQQEENAALGTRARAERLRRETRPAEVERDQNGHNSPEHVAAQVKRVTNGVFSSLKKEFSLEETYTGGMVLKLLLNSIQGETHRLLTNSEDFQPYSDSDEEEEEEELVIPDPRESVTMVEQELSLRTSETTDTPGSDGQPATTQAEPRETRGLVSEHTQAEPRETRGLVSEHTQAEPRETRGLVSEHTQAEPRETRGLVSEHTQANGPTFCGGPGPCGLGCGIPACDL
ncbi:FK506-binding protein 15 [Chanos chanos]|uniref:peptidylprolyl isomerase n=1 Tax=Chanos chanos TaxID=29144 RepID=A0A6J2VV22_CHACN|nr:FK506-binding protein 15-like [Chanos chanos]